MKRIVLAAAALAALSLPAVAGEGLLCFADGVHIHMPMAGGVGFSPLGALIDVNGEVWSSDAQQGTEIRMSEAFSGNHRIEIDFVDPNYERVLAEIRLFWTEEETDPVYGGTLKIVGKGAWAIYCGWG